MSTLSSHVLDTTLGQPAAGMTVELWQLDTEKLICSAETNSDGRISTAQFSELAAGNYRLRFHTQPYLLAQHGSAFFPQVDIAFCITPKASHYHVPLLLSPYGFSSYRGS